MSWRTCCFVHVPTPIDFRWDLVDYPVSIKLFLTTSLNWISQWGPLPLDPVATSRRGKWYRFRGPLQLQKYIQSSLPGKNVRMHNFWAAQVLSLNTLSHFILLNVLDISGTALGRFISNLKVMCWAHLFSVSTEMFFIPIVLNAY